MSLLISRNEAMKRLLQAEDAPYSRLWWERFGSPEESLKRQEAAERRAVEGVCPTCRARTIDHRCQLCGRVS